MKRSPRPFTVEFRRGPRTGPVAQVNRVQNTLDYAPASVPIVELPNPDRRNGRILPALEPARSGPPQVADAQFDGPPHLADADVANNEFVDDPLAIQPDEVSSDVVLDAGATPSEAVMADAVLAIRPRSRPRPEGLSRETFGMGERWKHRLPQAVRSKIKRGQREPAD